MKRFMASVLAATLLVSATLTGCQSSGQTASSSSGGAAAEQKVNLSFMWWGSQTRNDATLKVIKLYESKHPNVTITPTYQSFDNYFQKLSMMAAAGNMPDLFQFTVGAATGSEFIQKQLVEPLDSYVSSKVINLDDMSASAVKTGKIDGKLYGVVLGTNTLAMVVNPAMYKKAGLTVPTNGYATWADMEKDLTKIKAVTGAYGADDVLWADNVFGYWCGQYGQSAYDTKKIIGFDKKTYSDYMDLHKSWVSKGLVPPIDVTTSEVSNPANFEIVKQKSAAALIYTNNYDTIAKAASFPLQLIPMPGPNQDKATAILASQHMVMSSKSKNKEEAAKFMNFFINDVEANKILDAERGMPASTKVLNALKANFSDNQKAVADYLRQHRTMA
ncbi:ABC transporter substrate-binding protein [Caproicibacterium sp. XB1]|uniref:ABC transporter substrate-binding protein n=1 Tax=Caproicibacterium sp. XB1 TaxID=3396405 RepID=UPI0039B6EB0A